MAARQKDRVPTAMAVCTFIALGVLSVALAMTTSYGY